MDSGRISVAMSEVLEVSAASHPDQTAAGAGSDIRLGSTDPSIAIVTGRYHFDMV
jgi:hypothetical protein